MGEKVKRNRRGKLAIIREVSHRDVTQHREHSRQYPNDFVR